ncbi:uncharacterized protein [Aegilops tauschii subsp. strangulata]|uniref:uncharacterized protein n=1 Tax=Aegilops tauschii subsp. strangulata TaxID=200361 RepID=UPI00098B66B0|nr:uncharacterized protein LOC109747270 [Aegilops tauschii subsp. strangulata]
MTRSSSSSTSSRPRAPAAALDGPLLVLEHLLQTSSSGGGGVGKTTRAWGGRRVAPAARLAPRAGGLMMEDLHSWLHQRRRCRFCSPFAHIAEIGGGMEYCRGMDDASFGAEYSHRQHDQLCLKLMNKCKDQKMELLLTGSMINCV